MKTKHLIIIIIALIAVSYFCGILTTKAIRNSQANEILQLTDSMTVYTTTIDSLEQYVYEKDVVIGTKEQAIQAGILEQDRLKALNLARLRQITRLIAELNAAKDSIPMPDTMFITVPYTTVGSGEGESTYLKIPFSTGFNDEYIGLDFGVDKNKTSWFDLDAKVPLVITLGDKGRKQVASVTTPSPYIRITDYNVVNIHEEKWYHKTWVPVAGGAIGGLGLGYLLWGR